MTRLITFMLLLCCAGILAPAVRAQGSGDLGATFFKVSITTNATPLLAPATFQDSEGNLVIQGPPLVATIARAYGLRSFQVVDGPEWIQTPRLYDIQATPPPAFVESNENDMLKALLADRFKLVVHEDTRELTTLVLELEDSAPRFPLVSEEALDSRGYRRYYIGGPSISWISGNITLDAFALQLSNDFKEPVLNQTGLTGTYAIELKDLTEADPESYTQPLLEQLGLRLHRRATTVDVLVISNIAHPELDN